MYVEKLGIYYNIIRELAEKLTEMDFFIQDLGYVSDLTIDIHIIEINTDGTGKVLKEFNAPKTKAEVQILLSNILVYLWNLPDNYVFPSTNQIYSILKEAMQNQQKIYICEKIF